VLETHVAEDFLGVSTIPEALDHAAATTDHGIHLIDQALAERFIPYATLADAATRAAGALRKEGVEPGDRVCFLSSTTPEILVALFGAWRAGAVPVVLSLPRRLFDLSDFVDEVAGRVKAADARLLAVDGGLLSPDLPLDRVQASIVKMSDLGEGSPIDEPVASTPEDIALLQFTSGTTAASRAVTLTHGQILSNISAASSMMHTTWDHDVFVSWLPLFHDMGLIGMLLGSVSLRTPLVLEPPEEFLKRPGSWMDAMSRYRGTMTAAPNFAYGLAARDLRARPRDLDLGPIRMAGNGAEPIDADTAQGFVEQAAQYGFDPKSMCAMYGLAESTLAVTSKRLADPLEVVWLDRDELDAGVGGTARRVDPSAPSAKPLVSCGFPVPGSEVVIADADGTPLPEGQVGEICVRAPSLMAGYWRNPEGTAEVMRDGWLRTGDLGVSMPEGLLVCGRIKDVIIVGGRNLFAEDFEFWTERVPGVRRGNAIAFVVPGREQVVVVAETALPPDEAEAVARSILETLRTNLARGPEEVVLVPPGTLPKTSSGKRRRGACREQYASGELQTVAVASR
jgi:fatty-acyl-CoA synthase